MLRAGAALSEIGQVLGHRSSVTTSSYAKVAHDQLRVIARPWPPSVAWSAVAMALDEYLALRRCLGYKLERAGQLLIDFVAYFERVGADSGHRRAGRQLGDAGGQPACHAGGPAAWASFVASPATSTLSIPATRSRRPVCSTGASEGPSRSGMPRRTSSP